MQIKSVINLSWLSKRLGNIHNLTIVFKLNSRADNSKLSALVQGKEGRA